MRVAEKIYEKKDVHDILNYSNGLWP